MTILFLCVSQAAFFLLAWLLARKIGRAIVEHVQRRRLVRLELLRRWEQQGEPTLEAFLQGLERHEAILERACQQVVNLIDKVEGPKVTCTRCKQPYPAIFVEHRQGSNCAATAYEKEGRFIIQGHYGSTVCDLMQLEWLPAAPGEAKHLAAFLAPQPCDPICDPCIATLAVHGRIRIIGDTDLYGKVRT